MNEYKTVMTEIDQIIESHYQQSSLEKRLHCKTLKYANRMLESKLKKLKSLYEKKCAQCEAMKAALTLEQDLYDVTETPDMTDPFIGIESKLLHMTPDQRIAFCNEAISKTLRILGSVKNYALEGVITGEIISHCLQILQQENTEILFVDWPVIRDIVDASDDTIVTAFIDRYQANGYSNWLIVLHDNFHWSLLLYVKDKKAFYHYDSKPNRNHALAQKVSTALAEHTDSEQLFEVRCSPQANDDASGFHVIENITKLLPILDQGRITINNVDITLEKISLLKALPLKCRILVLKLYLQKKLQILNDTLVGYGIFTPLAFGIFAVIFLHIIFHMREKFADASRAPFHPFTQNTCLFPISPHRFAKLTIRPFRRLVYSSKLTHRTRYRYRIVIPDKGPSPLIPNREYFPESDILIRLEDV